MSDFRKPIRWHVRPVMDDLASFETEFVGNPENLSGLQNDATSNWTTVSGTLVSAKMWLDSAPATDPDRDHWQFMYCDFLQKAPNFLAAAFAPDRRIEMLETAVRAAQSLEWPQSEIGHLGNLIVTRRNAGKFQDIVKDIEDLIDRIPNSEVEEIASMLTLLGECHRTAGQPDYGKASKVLTRALALAGDKPYALKALTYHNLGIVAKNQGDLKQCVAYHTEERKVAESQNQPAEIMRALVSLGMAHFEMMEIDQALDKYTDALAITKNEDFTNSSNSTYIYVVDQDTGKATLRRGPTSETWREFHLIPIHGNRGIALCILGRYDEALKELTEARRLSEKVVQTRYEAVWTYQIGRVYHCIGNYPEALTSYDQSLELARIAGADRARGYALFGRGKTNMCKTFLASEDPESAIDDLRAALELAEVIRNPRDTQEWGVALAEALFCCGKSDDSRSVLDKIEVISLVENRFLVSMMRALVAVQEDPHDSKSRELLGRALQDTSYVIDKVPGHTLANYTLGTLLAARALNSSGNELFRLVNRSQEIYRAAWRTSATPSYICDSLHLLGQLKSVDEKKTLVPLCTFLQQCLDSSSVMGFVRPQ